MLSNAVLKLVDPPIYSIWRKRVVAVPQKEEEAEQDQHNIILLCMSRGQGLVWSRRRHKETMMIY